MYLSMLVLTSDTIFIFLIIQLRLKVILFFRFFYSSRDTAFSSYRTFVRPFAIHLRFLLLENHQIKFTRKSEPNKLSMAFVHGQISGLSVRAAIMLVLPKIGDDFLLFDAVTNATIHRTDEPLAITEFLVGYGK